MAREIKLVGFRYSKISSERNDDFKGELKITPGINIKNIEKIEDKKDVLSIEFNFNVDYGGLGKIELTGKMFLSTDSKTTKEALDGWKNKKMDNEINIIVLNAIMQKASLKALELEEELGLPPHVQLPRLRLGEQKK